MTPTQQLIILEHINGEKNGHSINGDTVTFQDERAYNEWLENHG